VIGIVTLEDVIESSIGEEIVDEVDFAVDMQEVARLRRRDQLRGHKADDKPSEES
jgi:CBS domain containing-hemolysin-like protein